MAGVPRATVVLLFLAAGWKSYATALLNNTLTQWINETRALARSQKLTNHLAIAQYTYVSVASYRALSTGGANENALAAFAAHTVNAARYPVAQPSFDRLLKAQLGGISDLEVSKAKAIALPIAYATLEERIGDPATTWKDYAPNPAGTRYGYQFLPNQTFSLAPQLADSQPYVWPADKLKAFSSNKDPKNGPVFEPPRTHQDLVAVVDAGAKISKTRSKYDTDTASFWALGSGVGGGSNSISGAFLDIAQKVLSPSLTLKQTALEFARISTAMHDAYIACWQVKYRTDFWRPTTAIQQGWPGFTPIPDWQPLLPVPPFPEYPSGHQCTAGAAVKVLQRALGRDQVTFSLQSDERPDIGFRTYTSLEAATQEAAKSRLFAGLHFPSANNDGQLLGKLVGEYVFDNFVTSPAAKPPASVNDFAQVLSATGSNKDSKAESSRPAATGRRLASSWQPA